MTRPIKFRGITASKPHRWIEGDLIQGTSEKSFIVVHNNHPIRKNNTYWYIDAPCFEVLPETVGQFTGLTDKNGKELWEGDRIHNNIDVETVVFQDGAFLSEDKYGYTDLLCNTTEYMTITGTIHDHLLG